MPNLALAAVLALLVIVPAAIAADVTREEYATRVEPICKTNTEANSRILKGVQDQVKNGKLKPAGRRFVRTAAALGKAISQISKVPQPTEDEAKLKKWIGYLKSEQRYLLKIGKALKEEKKPLASQYSVKLNQNNTRANNTVISFGFDECRIDSSRFL